MSRGRKSGLRVLFLLTDGFGGKGGIATYNRDVLAAMAEDPAIGEIIALPRLISRELEPRPRKVRYVTEAAHGPLAYFSLLLRTLLTHRFDLVYCAHVNLAPLAWLAAKAQRCRWLLAIYGIEAWQPTARRIADKAVRNADHVCAISALTRDRFVAWTGYPATSVTLLPNAIHLADFGVGPRKQSLENRYGLRGKRVVMTFGRMVAAERYKGFDQLLDVMATFDGVAEQDIVYLLAGDGSDRTRLKQKASTLGVADRVIFTGYIAEAEKADHYRLADVYAMPSEGEGFGFVLIEALACGIPAVGSKTDGGREALRDGMLGRLVDPNDLSEIRSAVLEAIMQEKVVPDGLAYFAFPAFRERLKSCVAQIVAPR